MSKFAFLVVLTILNGSFGQTAKNTTTKSTSTPTTTKPNGPIVKTTYGMLEGFYFGSKTDEAEVFLGIPFAQPPVDSLRFKPPVAPKAWKGLRSAKAFSDLCMQTLSLTTGQRNVSEDCLYLNVFRTKGSSKNASTLKPVMMFIHGGSYTSGGAPVYPVEGIIDNLASRGVIVVTINYRLNVFGFMTTNTSSLPANLGLWDQILALKWIKAEIENFGGDPNNVTVFGESAGASSLSILTYSPQAKGLFHKAIMQSGTVYSPWALDGNAGLYLNSSRDLAVAANCISASDWISGKTADVGECLRKISAEKLNELAANYSSWRPLVDGKGGVLPDWPENLVKSRDPNMPIILGTNRGESFFDWIFDLYLGVITDKNFTQNTFERQLNLTIHHREFGAYTEKVRDLVRFVYLEQGTPIEPMDYLEWIKVIVEMESGYRCFAPTSKEAQMANAVNNNSNVYLYSLDYVSDKFPWPRSSDNKTDIKAIFHTMDLYFLFKTLWQSFTAPKWNFSKSDANVSAQFGQLWTNFAKTGKPSESWDPLSSGQKTGKVAYSISVNSTMTNQYEPLATHLWNELIPEITGGRGGPTPTSPPPGNQYGRGYFVATWLLLSVVVLSVGVIIALIIKQHRENNLYVL